MNRPFIIALALCIPLSACQKQTDSGHVRTDVEMETKTSLRAYKDPLTGELTTPTEDELRRQNLESSTMGVKTEQPVEMIPLEGGGYRAPLGDRFQVESTATVQPDGRITIEETMR
jgi:hypothetical protein